MIRGIYTAASGMMALMNKQDVISNNLANVDTVGYKADAASFYEFPRMLMTMLDANGNTSVGSMGRGAGTYGTYTDYTSGQLRQTGNPLDLAVNGTAFFSVQTANGRAFTRNGAFSIDGNGRLCTKEGNAVLGANGAAITVGGASSIEVSPNGDVTADGNVVGRIGLFDLVNAGNATRKEGDNLFVSATAVAAANSQIVAGSLEGSNVNPINEMVEMITVNRSFETNQRMILAQDETLDRAVNTVGRV